MSAPPNKRRQGARCSSGSAPPAFKVWHGDGDRPSSAFAENARVSGSYSGKPVTWSLGEFCDVVARGGPAPGLQARIVSIEPAGGAAMARPEALDGRGTRYTDFFVMVRRDGDWRIDSKVFHAHSRA